MSLCDSCRNPGACCKGFVIAKNLPIKSWRKEVSELFIRHELNEIFIPVAAVVGVKDKADNNDPDRAYVQVKCNCKNLGKDGRCMDYFNRPTICGIYEPGSDNLCAEFVGPPPCKEFVVEEY